MVLYVREAQALAPRAGNVEMHVLSQVISASSCEIYFKIRNRLKPATTHLELGCASNGDASAQLQISLQCDSR